MESNSSSNSWKKGHFSWVKRTNYTVWQSASEIKTTVSICLTKCLLTTVLNDRRDEQTQMASSASSTLLLGFNFITCGLIFINKMKPTFFISLIFLLPGKDTSTQSLYKTSLYGIHILSTLPDFFKMNFMIHIYKIYTAYVILQTLVHHT